MTQATRNPSFYGESGGFAWVLNLDADLELAAGPRYEPSKGVRLAMVAPVAHLAETLLGPGDVLVGDAGSGGPDAGGRARGMRGQAFCPTPRAIAALLRAGAVPEAHPSVDVLRRVNSRAFAASLGRTLPDATFVVDLAAASAILRTEPAVGAGWRVKHAFGVAGRHQRILASPAAVLSPVERAFLVAGLARGGLQIEPNVAIVTEYALHARIASDGTTEVGRLVRQRCDARGAWRATVPARGADELGRTLKAEVLGVAAALHAARYFGPFGVDAYTYREGGRLALQPRSEINARYSMGFAVGFPPRTPAGR